MEYAFLVSKAQKGDGEAFIQLIKHYELILYRTAKTFGLKDEDIADILQETVLTAFEKISTLKKAQFFNTWICRILLNNCYRFMRQNKKIVTLDSETLNELAHHDNLPIELEDALNSLEDNYRIALTLYYVNGLTTKEISELLDEPEGTIKSRLSRAKQYLKNDYYLEGTQLL
ncbi:sigma-70 family RNA polymerase sigma factor [Lysinibacillus sp. NPDC097195]|uniref:sigma-70 family RNA polymerase sigma factor n=1 Tax=Lysinibacillus sp. NPDC097195 TaxID=3364141 RepID=UPI00380416D4